MSDEQRIAEAMERFYYEHISEFPLCDFGPLDWRKLAAAAARVMRRRDLTEIFKLDQASLAERARLDGAR